MTPSIDKAAKDLFGKNEELAVAFLTNYSTGAAERTFQNWKSLYAQLFMKYMDGNIKTPTPVPEGYKFANPAVKHPGCSEGQYKEIVTETDEQFKVIGDGQ